MLTNPRLGDETMMDIFLSGESALPRLPAVQLDGTDMEQLPSVFFTGFVSAAWALRTTAKIQTIRPDLYIRSSTAVSFCAGKLVEVN
jgi:hypothetical protein